LKNVYKALAIDYPDTFSPPPNKGGLLYPWADQGVLMLNAVLTVRAHSANSHQGKGWERFTQRVLDAVVSTVGKKRGVVFLAWGGFAQKRMVGISAPNLVLKAGHPSPLNTKGDFVGVSLNQQSTNSIGHLWSF
jgi:uracil-DNA glycosylase